MLNIGAEGQLHAGAMASVITALYFSALPAPLLLVISILAGIAAGMLVGSVPGIFKARFSTNEVIVAIMLNYICTLFTSYLVNGPFKTEGSTAQTELIAEGIWFGKLVPRTQLTYALFLLLFVAAAMYIFLWKTSVGYQLRAVGANPSASGTAGIRVNMFLIMSMTISGGIALCRGFFPILRVYGNRRGHIGKESSGRCAFDRIAFRNHGYGVAANEPRDHGKHQHGDGNTESGDTPGSGSGTD